jgi:hypothetical protein
VTLTSDTDPDFAGSDPSPGSLLPAGPHHPVLCASDARGFSGRIHTSGGESVEGHRMEEPGLWFTDANEPSRCPSLALQSVCD